MRDQLQGLRFMRETRDRPIESIVSFFKTDQEIAYGVYHLAVNHCTKEGMLNDAGLRTLVDEQLAAINPKDAPLSQIFDFSLLQLQQILKEGP